MELGKHRAWTHGLVALLFLCGPSLYAQNPAGYELRVGEGDGNIVAEGSMVELRLYLYRGSDVTAHSSAMSFRLTYDPQVLYPVFWQGYNVGCYKSSRLASWYSQDIAASSVKDGEVRVVVASLGGNEITTYDDQISEEGHDPTVQQNPFYLGRVLFWRTGNAGEQTAVHVEELVMVDSNADKLSGTSSRGGSVSIPQTIEP